MRVLETCTVDQVIGVILNAYQAEKRQPPLVQNTMAYVLRLVDYDGKPDDEFPGVYSLRLAPGAGHACMPALLA